MKRELFKNNWDFVLYEVDDKKVITVVFYNSFIDVSRSFYLTKEEECFNFDKLRCLSEDIRNHYENYRGREIIPAI